MRITPLSIAGAWQITPRLHHDDRGSFAEWYRFDHLAEAVGRPLDLAQGNVSVSRRGVVRGVHFADVPPGQAKYVMCARGAILDIVVDLRTGSPTYGQWEAVPLDDTGRGAVHLEAGLGHAFCALSEETVVVYLCSSVYNPAAERTVHPFDPDLAIEWPESARLLSDRDARAPGLRRLRDDGLLPAFDAGTRADEALRPLRIL
jgi:dTDP-4-dehydrorhamnose 3,5-epimerase